MKNHKTKKLSLRRETVRLLAHTTLVEIAGGKKPAPTQPDGATCEDPTPTNAVAACVPTDNGCGPASVPSACVLAC